MGCVGTMCERQSYAYTLQQQSLIAVFNQFFNLKNTFNNDFVIKAHKKLISNPNDFILLYPKKLQIKQYIPHPILQKWKLVLYGTNLVSLTYISCLGFESQLEEDRTFSKTYHLKEQNPFQIRLEDLYFHESYKQIEKDAGRAFLVPQIKQDLFEKILKKIANHFPDTGYSLGINYIVGYFLIVGYSEIDSFWMFVHLALNPKFLAMGLFEDKFPLAQILIQIFKNILKRLNKKLYDYIYKELQIMDQSWILKWLLSFYLSSFPIELCQYVWDYTLTMGIVGLSIFAVGITQHLKLLIFKCQDQAEFSQIFRSFQNLKKFSELIRMQIIMKQIYSIDLKASDFDQIQNLPKTFYSQYFHKYFKKYLFSKRQAMMQKQQIEGLDKWYETILKKRSQFTQLAKTANSKIGIPKIQQQSLSQQSQQRKSQKEQQKQQQLDQIKEKHLIINGEQLERITQLKQTSRLSSPRHQTQKLEIDKSIRKVKSQDLDQLKAQQKQNNQIIEHVQTNTVKVAKSVRQIDHLSKQSQSPQKSEAQINTIFKNISLLKRLSVQSGFSDQQELSVPKSQFKRSRSQSNFIQYKTQQRLYTPHSFQKIIIDQSKDHFKIQDNAQIDKEIINQINQSKLNINFETVKNEQFLGESKIKQIFTSQIYNKVNLKQKMQIKQIQKQVLSVKIQSQENIDKNVEDKDKDNQQQENIEIKQINENKYQQKITELNNNKTEDLGISQLFLEVAELQQKPQVTKINDSKQINSIHIQKKKTEFIEENQNLEQMKTKLEKNVQIRDQQPSKGQQHQNEFKKQTKE